MSSFTKLLSNNAHNIPSFVLLSRNTKSRGLCMCAKSLRLYLTLCNSVDCSPPGFSVHEILQARILVWVAMPSSRGSSRSRNQTRVSSLLHWPVGSLPLVPPGKPKYSSFIWPASTPLREMGISAEIKIEVLTGYREGTEKMCNLVKSWKPSKRRCYNFSVVSGGLNWSHLVDDERLTCKTTKPRAQNCKRVKSHGHRSLAGYGAWGC